MELFGTFFSSTAQGFSRMLDQFQIPGDVLLGSTDIVTYNRIPTKFGLGRQRFHHIRMRELKNNLMNGKTGALKNLLLFFDNDR